MGVTGKAVRQGQFRDAEPLVQEFQLRRRSHHERVSFQIIYYSSGSLYNDLVELHPESYLPMCRRCGRATYRFNFGDVTFTCAFCSQRYLFVIEQANHLHPDWYARSEDTRALLIPPFGTIKPGWADYVRDQVHRLHFLEKIAAQVPAVGVLDAVIMYDRVSVAKVVTVGTLGDFRKLTRINSKGHIF